MNFILAMTVRMTVRMAIRMTIVRMTIVAAAMIMVRSGPVSVRVVARFVRVSVRIVARFVRVSVRVVARFVRVSVTVLQLGVRGFGRCASDGDVADFELLSFDWSGEQDTDVKVDVFVRALGRTEVRVYNASLLARQEGVVRNQAQLGTRVVYPHEGFGTVVRTTLDFDGVVRVLLEVHTCIQAGGAAVLSAGDDQAVGHFGAHHHSLVAVPLFAGTRRRVDGDRFRHWAAKCERSWAWFRVTPGRGKKPPPIPIRARANECHPG